MVNEERLRQPIAAVLKVDPASLGDESSMDTIESWDSLQHMILMVALEEEFGVTIPGEEAVEATSFSAIKNLLERLTGIEVAE